MRRLDMVLEPTKQQVFDAAAKPLPDALRDGGVVGYEIPFTRHFYESAPCAPAPTSWPKSANWRPTSPRSWKGFFNKKNPLTPSDAIYPPAKSACERRLLRGGDRL